MLPPHITGGQPVTACIIRSTASASARRCASGTPARKAATSVASGLVVAVFAIAGLRRERSAHAAIDADHLAVDVTRLVRTQEGHQRGNLIRPAGARCRDDLADPF